MDIHFISTLTPDDEDRYAPVVLSALKAILEQLPISYAVRITTANARVFHQTKADPGLEGTRDARTLAPVDFASHRIA